MWLPLVVSLLAQAPSEAVFQPTQSNHSKSSKLPEDAPTVYVEIESNFPGTTLWRESQREVVGIVATNRGAAAIVAQSNESLCEAPCKQVIEKRKGDIFYVKATGMNDAAAFGLPGNGEGVRVQVKGGSQAVRGLGATAIALGVTAAFIGGLLWGIDAAANSGKEKTYNPYSPMPDWGSVGMYTTLSGGALVLAGIPMVASSGTDVKVSKIPVPENVEKKSVEGEL